MRKTGGLGMKLGQGSAGSGWTGPALVGGGLGRRHAGRYRERLWRGWGGLACRVWVCMVGLSGWTRYCGGGHGARGMGDGVIELRGVPGGESRSVSISAKEGEKYLWPPEGGLET